MVTVAFNPIRPPRRRDGRAPVADAGTPRAAAGRCTGSAPTKPRIPWGACPVGASGPTPLSVSLRRRQIPDWMTNGQIVGDSVGQITQCSIRSARRAYCVQPVCTAMRSGSPKAWDGLAFSSRLCATVATAVTRKSPEVIDERSTGRNEVREDRPQALSAAIRVAPAALRSGRLGRQGSHISRRSLCPQSMWPIAINPY